MIYRNGTELEVKEYNFLFHQGGLGDLIARLPAVKYVLNHHPQVKINMFVHDYGVELCKKALPYSNITIKSMTEAKAGEYKEELPTRSADLHSIKNLSCHMTDHAFLTLVGKSVEDKYKNYIQIEPIDISQFNLPKRYVVITTGFTSNTREWLPEHVNGFTNYLCSKGYTPVYLGRSYTPSVGNIGITGNFKCDYSNGINLIDNTSIMEAHAIMAGAKAVVGLDNGLLHLAAMSNVPIVYGLTTVDPMHRMPYRNDKFSWNCESVYPTKKELGCIGCQSNMNFSVGHNFTECYYKDYKCLSLMTPDKWIKSFELSQEPKTPEERAERALQTIYRTQELNEKIRELGLGISFDQPNDDVDFEETD